VADPDIQLGPHKSRHLAREANVICLSVSHVYFFVVGDQSL